MLVFETQKDFENAVRTFIEENMQIVANKTYVFDSGEYVLNGVSLKFNDEYAPYNFFATTD